MVLVPAKLHVPPSYAQMVVTVAEEVLSQAPLQSSSTFGVAVELEAAAVQESVWENVPTTAESEMRTSRTDLACAVAVQGLVDPMVTTWELAEASQLTEAGEAGAVQTFEAPIWISIRHPSAPPLKLPADQLTENVLLLAVWERESHEGLVGTGAGTVPTTSPSTSAPVELEEEGSFTRPATLPDAEGKFPVTFATPVAGEMPATWKYEPERFLPSAVEDDAQSNAPTVRSFGS